MGIRAVVYIDDGIVPVESESQRLRHEEIVLSDLEEAGFLLSIDKCCLKPCQIGEWLGFIIDLVQGQFRVPEQKLEKLKSSIRSVSHLERIPVRALASVVGQIMSMALALGPIARLRTRAVYADINCSRSWADKVILSSESQMELKFWLVSLDFLNGKVILFSSGATRIVCSDASMTGYGGYVVELGNDVAHGQWSVDESRLSSTWRELKAVYLVLLSFASKLAGHTVKWFTDNQGVVHIVNNGSRKEHLQDGAMAIFETCFQHNIKIEVEWIPRSENERADFVSRIVDHDDWGLDPSLFQVIDTSWGPHTVDCFATQYNALLSRFHSRFWVPGCEAVDTFTTNWRNELNWWMPPLYLVCRTIAHASQCQAKGTLIIPAWKSAPYWPVICPDGRHLAAFVHLWWPIKFYPKMFKKGKSGCDFGSSLTADTTILALFIDFTVAPRLHQCGFCTFDDSEMCDVCM